MSIARVGLVVAVAGVLIAAMQLFFQVRDSSVAQAPNPDQSAKQNNEVPKKAEPASSGSNSVSVTGGVVKGPQINAPGGTVTIGAQPLPTAPKAP